MQIHRDTLESIDFQTLPQNYWSPRKISEFLNKMFGKCCYSTNVIVPRKNFMISGGNWTCIFVPARTLWERKGALLKIYHNNRHKWDHSGKNRIICESNITSHFGITLKKINFNLGTSFRCTAKLNRRYREFLFTHSPHTYNLPQLTICGIFVKIDTLTLTDYYQST